MRYTEALLPPGGRRVDPELSALEPDALARYAADSANPWFRRRACVVALEGQVPEAYVPELIARLRDTEETGEVRQALLAVLGDLEELLPWLTHEDRRHERDRTADAILVTRGRLGDLTAVSGLTTLAASPWQHERAAGEAGLHGLVARHGIEAVLNGVGDVRPEDRAFRVRMRAAADEDVTYALADPDRAVAHLAQSLADDADRLRACIDEAPTTEAGLWAAYALHRLTEDAGETRRIYDRLGRPRVEVPGLGEELRAAIVHEYASRCQRQSDPRWRVEALCTEPPPVPDVDDQLRRAGSALTAAGLSPESPVSCGDHYQQGGGTYHYVNYGEDDDAVLISTLGPFATGHRGGSSREAREALEAAGFRWIDEATSDITVTDLCVYYFGDRKPLNVGTLLFYWQD
jgi:hypothetical protein